MSARSQMTREPIFKRSVTLLFLQAVKLGIAGLDGHNSLVKE